MRSQFFLVVLMSAAAAFGQVVTPPTAVAESRPETRASSRPVETFPWWGRVTGTKVNVRGGAGDFHKEVVRLERGSAVKVVARRGDWLACEVPGGVDLWISLRRATREYLEKNAEGAWVVKATRLQLRGTPSTDEPSLGTIEPGTVVDLVESRGDWGRIKMPESHPGWVFHRFVESWNDTAAAEKAFAAGADVREMASKSFTDVFFDDLFAAEAAAIAATRKPVIAAVSGFCLGGGCELAMMCDFIIASDTAKFGQPEINLGVVAGLGGTQRLTRFVGKSKSMDMHLTGRFMDAAEAERCGLVSRVVPAKDLLVEARKAATKIAEKSLLTAMAVKECVNRSYETTMRVGILYERRVFHALFATEDQKEGMAAFLEKRQPQFRDK